MELMQLYLIEAQYLKLWWELLLKEELDVMKRPVCFIWEKGKKWWAIELLLAELLLLLLLAELLLVG